MSLEMAENHHSDENTIDTVLQAAHSLHDRFLAVLKELQKQAMAIIQQGQQDTAGLAQIPFQFELLSEIMHMELDIDATYDDALRMSHYSPADMKILHDFAKERQQERMVVIREIMDNQIVQIASDDKLAAEMKDFINFVSSLDCPGCRSGGLCGDQEMCGIAVVENAEVPTGAVNQ